MSINIGNDNKIIKSNFIDGKNNKDKNKNKDKFSNRHPIITNILISFIVGFILLFTFWQNITKYIESIF